MCVKLTEINAGCIVFFVGKTHTCVCGIKKKDKKKIEITHGINIENAQKNQKKTQTSISVIRST